MPPNKTGLSGKRGQVSGGAFRCPCLCHPAPSRPALTLGQQNLEVFVVEA